MPIRAQRPRGRCGADGNPPGVYRAGPVVIRHAQTLSIALAANTHTGTEVRNLQILGKLPDEVFQPTQCVAKALLGQGCAVQVFAQLQ